MPSPDAQRNARKQHQYKVYSAESTGLVFIALLLLVLTLVRYWHNIHWSWR